MQPPPPHRPASIQPQTHLSMPTIASVFDRTFQHKLQSAFSFPLSDAACLLLKHWCTQQQRVLVADWGGLVSYAGRRAERWGREKPERRKEGGKQSGEKRKLGQNGHRPGH